MDEYLDAHIWGPEKGDAGCAALCAAFLSVVSKSVKTTALYTLNHPIVIESLGKAFALLNEVLAEQRAASLTISYANDNWLCNDVPVPVPDQDAQNLNISLRAHGLSGITFLAGVRTFELGVLCEFLCSSGKGQPEGYFMDFLAQRGVTNIRPEKVRYVKDSGWAPRASGPQSAPERRPEAARRAEIKARREEAIVAPAIMPRPEAVRSSPEITPRPAAAVPASQDLFSEPSVYKAAGGGAGPGAAEARSSPVRTENTPAGMNLGALLTNLVESAVKDPAERVRVYKDALSMISESMRQQVAHTTKALTEENARIINTRTRTEKVLAKVAEGKVVVDKDGKILMMNNVAEEISGKKLADVVGQHIAEHLSPGEHFLTISNDMDLSGIKPLTGEVRVQGDEQLGRSMRRSMALLEDADGRVVGAYSTPPDVIKFKEAQRMQEEFLSRVTHDLQSPLSSISSALEMLTDTAGAKLDPDENKFLSISVRNSRRLTEMIRGILDFSKLQSGKMPIHPEPVSAAAMLAEAGEGLLPWAKTKGLSLTVRGPNPDVKVRADHARIVQVLTNLVSNSIKSTPKGGSVIVAASRAANPEPCLVIGVRDNGRGIPKEALAKVFEKFVQLDSSEPREGVGLGLSIVKEFVALHGGKLWAESEPGKGATFYFTLPLA